MKLTFGYFFENLVEVDKPHVVHAFLKVHQDRHVEFAGDLRDLLDLRRVARDAKLLLADAFGAEL